MAYKSAKTGKFVSKGAAKKSPSTTYKLGNKPKKK